MILSHKLRSDKQIIYSHYSLVNLVNFGKLFPIRQIPVAKLNWMSNGQQSGKFYSLLL